MTAQNTTQAITSRPLADHDDFMRVRRFLSETYTLFGNCQNWEIRRWEGQWYWGGGTPQRPVLEYTRLWETTGGDLVGVVHIEGDAPGEAWFEVHPTYRDLENAMLDYAEAHLAASNDDSTRTLDLHAYDDDAFRRDLLTRRSYIEDTNGWSVLRAARLTDLLAVMDGDERPTPSGYRVRSLRRGDADDTAGWAAVVGATFGRTIEPAAIASFQRSPSYDHDMHLIAQSADGTFVSFAGLTVDTLARLAVFEPVGTHPDHRQRGLAGAVMREGLRRLRARGGVDAVVLGTGDAAPANALYDSLGFNENRRLHRWRRTW